VVSLFDCVDQGSILHPAAIDKEGDVTAIGAVKRRHTYVTKDDRRGRGGDCGSAGFPIAVDLQHLLRDFEAVDCDQYVVKAAIAG